MTSDAVIKGNVSDLPDNFFKDTPKSGSVSELPSGFFTSSSKPVMEDTYREDTGEIISAPSGLGGRAINYLDDTQNQSKPKNNFLGFSNVGNPVNFAQGYVRGIIQTAADVSTVDLASQEKALRDIGDASQKDFSVSDVFKQFLPTRQGKFAEIRTSQALGRGKLSFEAEDLKIRSRIGDIRKIDKDLSVVLDAMGLNSSDQSLAGQVGQGGSSLAMTVGTYMITKTPAIGAMVMASQTNSSAYKKAREAKLPINEAANAALVESVGVALIEAVGTNALFKVFGESNIMKKAVKGFLVQGTEEGAQEVFSIMTKNNFDVTDTNAIEGFSQVLNSFIVGGLIGAPVAASMQGNPNAVKDLAKKLGVSEEDVLKMADVAEGISGSSETIRLAAKQTIDEVFDEEFSSTTDNKEDRAQVSSMATDFLEGRDIDYSNLNEFDRKVLDELFNVSQQQIDNLRVEEDVKAKEDETKVQSLRDQINTARSTVKARPPVKSPVIDFLKKRGGIEVGSPIDTELRNMAITPRTAPGLFKRKGRLDAVRHIDNIPFDEFLQDTGIIPKNEGGHVDRQFLLDQLDDEIRGLAGHKNQDIESAIQFMEDLDRLGLDLDTVTAEQLFQTTEGRAIAAETKTIPEPSPLRPSEVVTKDVLAEVGQVDADTQGLMSQSFLEPVGDFFIDFTTGLERAITPISTRIKNISIPLFFRVREFEFRTKTNTIKDHDAVIPFIRGIRRLDKDTKIALDIAMKNSNEGVISQIAEDNNLVAEITAVRQVLDDLFDRATAVDMDVKYRWDFFPRKVKNLDGLMDYFKGSEHWSIIQEAFRLKEDRLGTVLDDAGRIGVINQLIMGRNVEGISLAQKGIHKERTIRKITADIDQFYAKSDQALLSYINIANEAIETSRLFGVGQDIDGASNIENSVGKFINDLTASGEIKSRDARILKETLGARFNSKRMGYITSAIRDLSYIDTMGSFTSALTQVTDLAISVYNSGLLNTATSLGRAIINRTQINLKDVGVEQIGIEFADGKLTSKAVNSVFTATGLKKIDNVGKLTLVNSAYKKFQQRANKGDGDLLEQLTFMFGDRAGQVMQDLRDGVINDDTKFLVFNTLLDMQPVALSEMPEYYLQAGNLKILYMLKSFTIRQTDIYRREVLSQLNTARKTGDAKLAAKAMGNFIRLAGFWVSMGAGVDYVKDLLRSMFNGDEVEDPKDYVIDNILKSFGFSRYQLNMVGKKGATEVFFDLFQPPAKFLTNVGKDFKKLREGDLSLETSKSIRSIPLGGELYYFWFGAGQDGASQQRGKKKKTRAGF